MNCFQFGLVTHDFPRLGRDNVRLTYFFYYTRALNCSMVNNCLLPQGTSGQQRTDLFARRSTVDYVYRFYINDQSC